MIFSDFYITRDFKIEILPTDYMNQVSDVLNKGDRLITVFRPIDGDFAVKSFKLSFIEELKQRFEVDTKNIQELLFQTVTAFGVSLNNPPADYIPPDKIELVVVYIKENVATIVKVGDISVKDKSSGKFTEMFEGKSNPLGPNADTQIMLKVVDLIS